MGLRSWLFGCRGHHWEPTGYDTSAVGFHRLNDQYRIYIEKNYECKHDGCSATKTDYEHTATLTEERGEEILDELKGEDDE